jgi:hypothetical protein
LHACGFHAPPVVARLPAVPEGWTQTVVRPSFTEQVIGALQCGAPRQSKRLLPQPLASTTYVGHGF